LTTFGERLRQLRREARLSQGELAGEGLSASYISLLESGKRSPSREVVHTLAARLGCSSTQLEEGKPSEREQRIALEMAYAKLAMEHGESADAVVRLENLLREDGLTAHVRDEATFLLGTGHERASDLTRAVTTLQPLYARALEGRTHISACLVGMVLSYCYQRLGDLNHSARVGEESLQAAQRLGLGGTDEYFRLAATVMFTYVSLGDFVYARTWAQDFIAEAEAAGDAAGQAALYWNSAMVAELEGRVDEALHLCERALARMGELENHRDYARLRQLMAEMLLADSVDLVRANDLLERCFDDLHDLGGREDLGRWNVAKATAFLHEGDLSGAEGRARRAVELLVDEEPIEHVRALLVLSDALVAQGRIEDSTELRHEVFRRLAGLDRARLHALVWRELGERLADHGEFVLAREAFGNALDCAGVRDRSRATREASRANAPSQRAGETAGTTTAPVG
jgi:transcriptional regulator with XRE-family HTH domain